MRLKKELNLDLEATRTARDIVQTFEEIAASRLIAVRGNVAQTRAFLDEIAEINHHVRRAFTEQVTQNRKKSKQKKNTTSALTKNGRTAQVLLSANRGLYGDLPLRIVREFIKGYQNATKIAKSGNIDVIAVGLVGQYLLDYPPDGERPIPYKGFLLDDDKPKDHEIDAVFNHIVAYDRVVITYGKFQSLLSVEAETVDITGADNTEAAALLLDYDQNSAHLNEKSYDQDKEKRILFEPSIETIMAFFETTILKALLRQKIFEMQLARFASRMVAMDGAEDKANTKLDELSMEQYKLKRKLDNKKMQQIFAGRALWEEN